MDDYSMYKYYKGEKECPYNVETHPHQNYFWRLERNYHEHERDNKSFNQYLQDYCSNLDDKAMSPQGEHLRIYHSIER